MTRPSVIMQTPEVKLETVNVQMEEPQLELNLKCGAKEGIGEVELEIFVDGQALQIEQVLKVNGQLTKDIEHLSAELDVKNRQLADMARWDDQGRGENEMLRQLLAAKEAESAAVKDRLEDTLATLARLTAGQGGPLATQSPTFDDFQDKSSTQSSNDSSLSAQVQALQHELAAARRLLNVLGAAGGAGGARNGESQVAALIREHQEKAKTMAAMTRELEDMRGLVTRLIRANAGIATHVARRKATLRKEDVRGTQREWLVMGGPEGGASLKDPTTTALKIEVARLEELERYEQGLTRLRDEEWDEMLAAEKKTWAREEEYYRKHLELNEQEVWQVMFQMASRERWSIAKYILGKKLLRDGFLGVEPGSYSPRSPRTPEHSMSSRSLAELSSYITFESASGGSPLTPPRNPGTHAIPHKPSVAVHPVPSSPPRRQIPAASPPQFPMRISRPPEAPSEPVRGRPRSLAPVATASLSSRAPPATFSPRTSAGILTPRATTASFSSPGQRATYLHRPGT
jgi:hypothetical protein